jgi:hypothetical protein
MADIKKPGYQIAYDQRQRELEDSIRTEHRGAHESETPQDEIKPSRGSTQLGEGNQ